ncbi:MAG TPA: VWA domain-containing protein [Terriglobia bacterium]|nr:VWA domain-containing protein [Terriglobia bacterium]
MSRTGLVLLIAGFLAAPIVAAQLKVDVALVNIVATVTDETGHYVSDLTQDDLIVEEDGKQQTIAHFSQSNDLPVSMGVVLDTSGSMERKIGTATAAVERFIRSIHREDDIFLMTFSNRPDLLQDFTDDRDKLARALRRVVVGGGTALYDALDLSLRKIKHGTQDKKAILLLTDGEDTTSESTFEEAQTAVRESEILVYCLGISPSGRPLTERTPYPTGPSGPSGPNGRRGPIGIPFPTIPGIPIPGSPGGGPRIPGRYPAFPQQNPRTRTQIGQDTVDMQVLEAFADASGGKAWLVSGNWTENRGSEIQGVLDEIAAELRNQYSIGYYPPHDLKDGKWHRIEIRSKNKRYHVRARKEYFGK